jgi:hypothetical protein
VRAFGLRSPSSCSCPCGTRTPWTGVALSRSSPRPSRT